MNFEPGTPFHDIISSEDFVKLADFQFNLYGTVLDCITEDAPLIVINTGMEPISEIEKLMAQPRPGHRET